MAKKFSGSNARSRRRGHKAPGFHQLGRDTEDRFFALVEANPHWLPPVVLEIRRATAHMDRYGRTDAIVIMRNDVRLYLDIKSSEDAVNHKNAIDLTIPFVLKPADTAEEVLANLTATILREYGKVLACQVEPLLIKLAATPKPRNDWLQAAE